MAGCKSYYFASDSRIFRLLVCKLNNSSMTGNESWIPYTSMENTKKSTEHQSWTLPKSSLPIIWFIKLIKYEEDMLVVSSALHCFRRLVINKTRQSI